MSAQKRSASVTARHLRGSAGRYCPGPMALYDALADLPLEIDGYTLEGRTRTITPEFERLTTTIHLQGGGEEGLGEDVTYDPDQQRSQQERGPVLPLAGGWTLGSFSEHARRARPVRRRASRACPRSATTAAGRTSRPPLDLALRQAGRSLAAALGREPEPITFVVSLRLGEPPSIDPVTRRSRPYPGTRFKLDSSPTWDDAFVAALAETGAVASVDFKGAYKGTPVDTPTDPELYRRCAEGLPGAWPEDPDLTVPEADAALEPYRDRITWDAPIHGVADIEALPFLPRTINVKPSRIGPVAELLRTYEWCAERGIVTYGGGQSELGVGRGPDPVPRVALPPARAERHRALRLRLARVPRDRPRGLAAAPRPRRDRLPPALVD